MFRIACFLMVLLCLGCRTEPSSPAEVDTTLDIRLDRDPDRLHPVIYPRPTARQVFSLVFLPLANFDPVTTELEPILVEEVPVKKVLPDGRVAFDITFKQDARWPNGTPITAADYLFTLKAIAHPAVNASAYRAYTSTITDLVIDPDDRRRCTVILDSDYLLALETVVTIEVYPEYYYDPAQRLQDVTLQDLKALDDQGVDQDTSLQNFAKDFNGLRYSQHPIGAGPYEVTEYVRNKYVKLQAKEPYWGSAYPAIEALAQGPENILFHIIPDENNAVSLLKEGDIDLLNKVAGATFLDLQTNAYAAERLSFDVASVPKFYYLQLNTASAELADPLTRKALDHLVDKQSIIEALETGSEYIPNSHLLPSSPYYNKKLPHHRFDIAEAKNLLDQAGWVDTDDDGVRDKVVDGQRRPLTLIMGATPGKLSADIGQILKSDAAKAGVEIELIPQPYNTYKQNYMETGKFHIAALASGQDLTLYDPYQRYHSSNAYSGSNYSGYYSKTLDSLILDIRKGGNYERLKPLYDRFQSIIIDDMPLIFLYAPSEKIAHNKSWQVATTIVRPGYLANTAQWKSQ